MLHTQTNMFIHFSSIECVYCSALGAIAVCAKLGYDLSMFRSSKLHKENSNKDYKYN